MCSYPRLQYHFDQYELDCRHRDTPREVHEQRFAGSSFAHHPPSIQHQFPSIASGKRSVACAVPVARSSAVIPVRSSFFIAHHSSEEAVQWTKYLLTLFPCKAPVANLGSRKRLEGKLVVFALMLAVSALTLWYWQQPISPLLLRPTYRPR